ncbi:MAG: hypothetical protein M3O46_04745, partial [Myxococcota bacterium]|nr:hypothetical protein [Myxococcota bacterium]
MRSVFRFASPIALVVSLAGLGGERPAAPLGDRADVIEDGAVDPVDNEDSEDADDEGSGLAAADGGRRKGHLR